MKASTIQLSLLLAWAIAVTLLLVTGAAVADEPAATGDEPETATETTAVTSENSEAAPAPAMSGLRVTIDPETGQMVVPPPADRRKMALSPAMQNAFSQSDEGLPTVVLPDGTVMVNLQGRFRNLLFATVDAEGQLKVGHEVPEEIEVSDESEAEHE